MASKLPICRWTVDEALEFMIDIGAVVQNDNSYTSGWTEDLKQWTKNQVCIAISKKWGYTSKHTRTIRNLVDRVTEEFQIEWNYQGRWVFEKTLAKEVSEMSGYDVVGLNRRDWRRVICYYSGLKRSGLSDEKIRERMMTYLPKVFSGVRDVRRCRINGRPNSDA